MFFSKRKEKTESPGMNWKFIEQPADIDKIKETSIEKPVVIFKHSTSCSISATALGRFERKWSGDANADVYLLNLLQHRDLSNQVAAEFGVQHQSPQVLVIKAGKSIYDESHFGISAEKIAEVL